MGANGDSRVIVTGGTEFVGRFLCEKLVEAEHEVLCVDNFYTGRRANITHLLSRSNFELLRHDITFPLCVEVNRFSGPVTLGNLVEVKVRNLAAQIIRLAQSVSRVEHQPLSDDDPQRRRPDISLAKRAVDWQPSVPPEEGLRRTISYFRALQIVSKKPGAMLPFLKFSAAEAVK